jgi:hypothetical protein
VVADARARQVDAGVDVAERWIPRVGGAGVPADLIAVMRRPPDQADDLVAVRPQARRQYRADQPG